MAADPDELRSLFLFADLGDDQLRDLVATAEEVTFAPDEVLFREGEPARDWWVLLEGRVDLVRRSASQESTVGAMDRAGLWAGGFQAWTDAAGYMATGRAETSGRVLRLPAAELGRLTRTWFPLGVHLIEGFFQTVRGMETLARQRAGLIALGTLAAGLAHELNNPATAAERATAALRESSEVQLDALVRLAGGSISAEQFMAIDTLRRDVESMSAVDDPLEAADREEDLLDWLERHGVPDGWRVAATLAASGVGLAWAERVAAVAPDTLGAALEWISATVATTDLLDDIAESTSRVSTLVDAVKSYSQLDRASLRRIDLTGGITSTLAVLAHRLGDDVTVVRDDAADLPDVEARPSELNQVWTNLVDNAVDAMDGSGTLRITTRPDGDDVVVEVADTGTGMTEDVRERAFEPFYTTKEVGKGTGLGLDISRRIVVDRHHGTITIASDDDGTVVTVRLPRDQP